MTDSPEDQLVEGAINGSLRDFHNDRVVAKIGVEESDDQLVSVAEFDEQLPPQPPADSTNSTLKHIQGAKTELEQAKTSQCGNLKCCAIMLGILIAFGIFVALLLHYQQ
jgi:hypothetical protein